MDGNTYSPSTDTQKPNHRWDARISKQQGSGRQNQKLCITIRSPRRNNDGQRPTVLRTRIPKSLSIKQITTSPNKGFIERHVRHIKSTKKCLRERNDVRLALIQVRVIPIETRLPSPTKLLLRRPLTTTLLSWVEPGKKEHRKRLEERPANMKINYDLNSQNKELTLLYTGQCVRILNIPNNTWYPETITQKDENPRDYVVETQNGVRLYRNHTHLPAIPVPGEKKIHFAYPEPDTTKTTSGLSGNSVEDKTTSKAHSERNWTEPYEYHPGTRTLHR